MPASLRRTIKISIGIVTVPVLIVGSLILYDGLQHYIDDDLPADTGGAFATTLLGLTIVSFPLTTFFGYKTSKSLQRQRSQYDQPDVPLKFVSLIIVTSMLVFVTFLCLTLYIVTITS